MRNYGWLTFALASLALLVAVTLVNDVTEVHSGGQFQNSHSEIPCTDCHALSASTGSGSFSGQIFRKECERCHTPEVANNGGIPLGFHADRDKGCPECHSFHTVEKITVQSEQFRVSFENTFQRAQCYSCHRPFGQVTDLSPGHRAAAGIYHSDFRILGRLSSSESCLICHSQTSTSVSDYLAVHAKNAPCFDEHGSHPVGVRVDPGSGNPGNKICREIDSRIQLFGGKIECQSCHNLTSRNQYRLVSFGSQKELCRACHQVD